MAMFQRILVPVDDSETARRALALALRLARRGLSRLLPGSGAEQVLRTSDVPVLLARGQ